MAGQQDDGPQRLILLSSHPTDNNLYFKKRRQEKRRTLSAGAACSGTFWLLHHPERVGDLLALAGDPGRGVLGLIWRVEDGRLGSHLGRWLWPKIRSKKRDCVCVCEREREKESRESGRLAGILDSRQFV